MKNGKKELDWEVAPWNEEADAPDYAMWAERGEDVPQWAGPISPHVAVSNQNDCNERLTFSNVPELDAFMARRVAGVAEVRSAANTIFHGSRVTCATSKN